MFGIIEMEHLSRYLLACELTRGLKVLDIACGEGYGSYMLAHSATEVIGVDLSADTVSLASSKYNRPNLVFKQGDACHISLVSASLDAVISFETIEHHDKHVEMLLEIKRVLKPGGFLLISSPDKKVVTDETGVHNPYHIKELYKNEFQSLMTDNFNNCKFANQRVLQGALITWDNENTILCSTSNDGESTLYGSLPNAPYVICIASDSELPPVHNLLLETKKNLFKTTVKGGLINILKKLFPNLSKRISVIGLKNTILKNRCHKNINFSIDYTTPHT